VESWIKSMHTGWCIPSKNMGPDLMTWLRLSDGRLLLVIFQAKCYLTGNLHTLAADVTADAIRSLIPARFFSNLKRATAQEEIDDMLKPINEAEDCFTGARYNILRVIAAYPLDANLDSQSENIQGAIREDKHPLATLRHAPLLASLTRCDSTPSVLSSLSTSLKRLRGEDDDQADQADVGQPSSKTRKILDGAKIGTRGAKSGRGGTKRGKGAKSGKKNQ